MQLPALALILAAVFAWAVVSGRARVISAPIFFVAVGLLLAEGVKLLHLASDPHLVKLLAEVTLVWVLFADASRVQIATLRQDAARYLRLLGIGLPLTVALGTLMAIVLLDLSPWYALLLGAALAPTDAALGAAVMTDQRVPASIRQTLNVESGLNDGLATPIVTTALAAILIQSGAGSGFGLLQAVLGLPLGVVVGLAIGIAGGTALRLAHRRGWSWRTSPDPRCWRSPCCRSCSRRCCWPTATWPPSWPASPSAPPPDAAERPRCTTSSRAAALPRCSAGCCSAPVAVPRLVVDWSWQILLYAVASLTVIRILPVLVALVGDRLDWRSKLFVGWFGPRGLASVVFALIAMEDLHDSSGAVDIAVATIGLTVLASVLLHGLSAQPLVARYAAGRTAEQPVESPPEPPTTVPVRHLVRPSTAPHHADPPS